MYINIACPSCHNLNWVTRAIGASIAHCVGIENRSQIVQLAREQGRALGDVPSIHDPYLSSKKPRLTEPFLSCVFSALLHHFSFFMHVDRVNEESSPCPLASFCLSVKALMGSLHQSGFQQQCKAQ